MKYYLSNDFMSYGGCTSNGINYLLHYSVPLSQPQKMSLGSDYGFELQICT